VTGPRRTVRTLLGERPSYVVALDETVLAVGVRKVPRLLLIAEFLCKHAAHVLFICLEIHR